MSRIVKHFPADIDTPADLSAMIVIRISNGETRHVSAVVFGTWAAHVVYMSNRQWTVTHVPTGIAIPWLSTSRAKATAIARRLCDEITASSVRGVTRKRELVKHVCDELGAPLIAGGS